MVSLRLGFGLVLAGFCRYFSAFLARFRKAYSDGLLSRRDDPAFAGTKRAELFAMEGVCDALARSFIILP